MKKKSKEPIAAACAVIIMIVLRFAIKRIVKKYSGVRL